MDESGLARYNGIIAACALISALAVVALALRCLSNYLNSKRRWGYDDLFAILTLPFIITETAIAFWMARTGWGNTSNGEASRSLGTIRKQIYINELLLTIAISLPRLSVLFFYRRIFERTKQWFFVAVWIVGGLCTGWLLATFLVTVFQCNPVPSYWEQVDGAACLEPWPLLFGTALSSTILDVIILLLPVPMLWGLHASMARKIFIICVFLCGYGVVVISVGRLVTLATTIDTVGGTLSDSFLNYSVWVHFEAPVSLISVCLPNLYYLGRRVHSHGLQGLLRDSSSMQPTPNDTPIKNSRSALAVKELNGQNVELHSIGGSGAPLVVDAASVTSRASSNDRKNNAS